VALATRTVRWLRTPRGTREGTADRPPWPGGRPPSHGGSPPKPNIYGGHQVNAAFLLVTSAWLAGADPVPQAQPGAAAPAPAAAAPAPATAAPAPAATTYGGCGSCCNGYAGHASYDCGCESSGLFGRLHARFSRHNDGCDTCSSCAPSYHTWNSGGHSGGCGAVSSCDSCGSSGLFGRLRGRFHHGSDCGCDTGCSTGCSSCGTYAAPTGVIAPKPAGEPIKAPKEGEPIKKMPEGAKPTDKEARAPATLQVAPAATRVIETGTRSPY
jgi:hypothetical protein